MKGNKKLLIVAVLLLLIAVSYSSYAIYKSSASSSASSLKTAAWVVEVNGDDIVTSNTFTLGNITWSTHNGKGDAVLAPGDSGYFEIVVDASGSEVDVDYAVTVDTTALASLAGGRITATRDTNYDALSGTISYGASMTKTIRYNVEWTTSDDDTTVNPADVAARDNSLAISATVTATQHAYS